jgi:diguanylate cyclase (GGDEF)-like protein
MCRCLLAWILCWGLLAGPTTGLTPRGTFRTFDLNGKPFPPINGVTQDAGGALWVGTDEGLFRYDGSRFHRFGMEDGLVSLGINYMLPRPDGGLWLGTQGGLVGFQQGQFTTIPLANRNLYRVGYFGMDSSGRAYVPFKGEILHTEGGRFVKDPGSEQLPLPTFVTWSGHRRTMVALDGKSRFWSRQVDGTWTPWMDAPELKGATGWYLTEDGQGTLWAGLGLQLFSLEPGDTKFRNRSRLLSSFIEIFPLTPDPVDGALSILCERGILRIRSGYPATYLPRTQLRGDLALSAAFKDRQGNLWMGGDVLLAQPSDLRFQSFTVPESLGSTTIQALCNDEDDNALWVGCSTGLFHLKEGRWSAVPALRGRNILQILPRPGGELWLAVDQEGILRLRRGAKVPESLLAQTFRYFGEMAATPDGTLYVVNQSNWIDQVDTLHGPATPKPLPTEGLGKIPRVSSITVDPEGRLWLAGGWGVAVFQNGKWQSLGTEQGLPAPWARTVRAMRDGTIWASLQEPRGAVRIRLVEGRPKIVEHITQVSGLPGDSVYGFGEDKEGRVWIATGAGPARWSPKKLESISVEDGLPSLSVYGSSFPLNGTRGFWFSTTNALVEARHVDGLDERPPPVVRISKVDTGLRHWHLVWEAFPALAHDESNLAFDYGPESPTDWGRLTYQLRMKGLQSQWQDGEGQRAQYPGLQPGTYHLEVRGRRSGEPYGPPTSLRIVILPPWYLTLIAKMCWALLALAALVGAARFWQRRLVRRHDLLERLVARRTEQIQAAQQELAKANEALRNQSLTDPLTGLRNRRYLDLVMEDETRRVDRSHEQLPHGDACLNNDLVMIMVDLDHFKAVNDEHGHGAGDLVLQEVSARLTAAVRDTDVVVRMGGEEFLVVARESNRGRAPELAERICSAMSQKGFDLPNGPTLGKTCSIGFAVYPFACAQPGVGDWLQALEVADRALYAVKRGGRNGWAGFLEMGVQAGQMEASLEAFPDVPGVRAQSRENLAWPGPGADGG